MLLCHTKAHGIAGVAKALNPLTASRLWFMGEESVRQMLLAAEQSDALNIANGEWEVLKWKQYQGDETGAERQRRFKSKQQVTGGNALVTEVTPTMTETMTETETIEPKGSIGVKKSKGRPGGVEVVKDYLKEIGCPNPGKEGQRFYDHFTANGWVTGKARHSVKDWKACARTWAGNARNWAGEAAEVKSQRV